MKIRNQNQAKRVMDLKTAFQIDSMLKDVINFGTGRKRRSSIGRILLARQVLPMVPEMPGFRVILLILWQQAGLVLMTTLCWEEMNTEDHRHYQSG